MKWNEILHASYTYLLVHFDDYHYCHEKASSNYHEKIVICNAIIFSVTIITGHLHDQVCTEQLLYGAVIGQSSHSCDIIMQW